MFSSGIGIFVYLFLSIFVFSTNSQESSAPKTPPQVEEPAKNCRKDICLLPNCKCDEVDIPGGIPLKDTPQIVLITFDDAVNDGNKQIYADLFERGRKNPNGCPISATFYVTQGAGGTDYSQVQNLYAAGHEMASHTITHSHGKQFSYEQWASEVDGQRELLATYGGVKREDIRGMRAPYLEVGGDTMFKMLYDYNFTYDSSMPIYENRPPRWPYTLDYKLSHNCMIPPCPTKSYPGIWEVPMVVLEDLKGGRCAMVDFCSNSTTSADVYRMFMNNFERHYTTNRAPFYVYFHATWFAQAHSKQGFISFLDKIVAMNDVWVITNWQAIQWIKNPVLLGRTNNFAPFGCNYQARPKCSNPKFCSLQLNSKVQYVKTCQICPAH